MTLAEKIGQLNFVPNSPQFDDRDIEAGWIGGVLAFTNARDVARAQAAARRSAHRLPLLVGLDVLHGLRTIFPQPLAEAGSFDPGLARETARAAGREAAALGINWTFGPVADLARDPRWGRMIEGSGEDPLLGRVFTAARVTGFREAGLAATLKHFAGYGAAEGGRDYDRGAIAPADLHENYLPPFKAGIEARAETVMSAFLSLNGLPVSADRSLLTGILKERFGFSGFVISDWNAVGELIQHGVAAGPAEAARLAVAAGIDADMYSGLYADHLAAEVAAGRVPEARVTDAARRVVRTKLRLGLAGRPDPDTREPDPPAPGPELRALARRAARDSTVLLRNEGVLPLRTGQRVAVVGPLADSAKNLVGPHAALFRAEDGVTALGGLRGRAEGAGGTVEFAPGCEPGCRDAAGFETAVVAAARADVIVAVMGETNEMSGEGASRARLTLPGRQGELLERLVATGKPVVLVLFAGRPIELGPVLDRLGALLMAWFPGTEGGNALADLLFGDAEPSAKLAVSWPRTIGQVPLTYDQPPTGRPHDPADHYTLRYVDEEVTPLFPFGFGKTYTDFAFSDLAVLTPRVQPGGELVAEVRIRNVGARPGREVAQLYLRQLVASRSRPHRKLKAFEKLALAPGEERVVTFRVPAAELGFYAPDGSPVLEPGRYQIFVGSASDATLTAYFEVAGR